MDLHSDITATSSDKTPRNEAASAAQYPQSILEAFEHIVEAAQDSRLSEEFFDQVVEDLEFASRMLNLTPMQTCLLALFVDISQDCPARLSEVASYTGCRPIKILRLSSDIDTLTAKHYIRAGRDRTSMSYRISSDVIKTLVKNQPYRYEVKPISNLVDFFVRFNNLTEDIHNGDMTYEILLASTTESIAEISTTHFAKTMDLFDMSKENVLLFVYMAHLFVENNDDCIGFHDIRLIYDNNRVPDWCKRELRNHTSELFEYNLIENVNEDGMARSDSFKLTDFAKTDLLAELNLTINHLSGKALIKHDTLSEKRLIYNTEEKSHITELSSILSVDRFAEVQNRLRDAGMRTGFCSLFYGSPGTGKTETVYQIARATGRDILRVDVDKIKSCWVGESEQNIKKVFDQYRNICKDSTVQPILLFNEADAILGLRMEGATRAVDKMENSIQNIILQEMETLSGIMIATTNLTSNLDKAFERRFLYKIRFNRPTTEARAAIWQSMLPSLTKTDASVLASRFDLSGGQIENIVRKYTVKTLLSGQETIGLESIMEICSNEHITDSARKKIGF